ncbi:hypothetical protein KFK09_017600 [Dendrobium nobile]|uniref:Reverse transcriptase Ty1/copia-type domain-containing protein n=1 Tax=Dendrobium nobile TaxID=94219 RepID=A0A8T3B2Y4_DENNO|nr:hypothetical protein KFK09_017600 [Dendrobium nobile]
MSIEYMALQPQSTWSLIPPSPNTPIFGCKWTFKIKKHPNGHIALYKARLVAQGCSQEFGVNYTDTFSPVEKMPTIRILITLALHKNWHVLQLDVSNTFLHGDL